MEQPLKIVITGPESTGKSQLCQTLCAEHHIPYYGEYARSYLEKTGAQYGYKEFIEIYQGHLALQRKAVLAASDLVLLDTDSINFKVWAQRVFKEVPDEIEEQIPNESDHLYLITYPDLPWQADPLRANPNDRLDIFNEHKALIRSLNRPFKEIRGQGVTRLQNARSAISDYKRQASF